MKVKVPVIGTVNKSVSIETDVPSRAEVTTQINTAVATALSKLPTGQNTTPSTGGAAATVWKLIKEIPLNIQRLAALASTGLIVRQTGGLMTTRSLVTANSARLTVTNGSGDSGNPTIDMADIDARSAWGRPSNTSGKPVAIVSTGDKAVLHESGGALSFDVINTTYTQFSAGSRICGRLSSAGNGQELTLTEVLDMVGSAAQGDILFRGASAWQRLAAGTLGNVLSTNGTGANPSWIPQSASGGSSAALTSAILADSPTGYWKLTEASGNFADSSGAGNTLVASGTIVYQACALILADPSVGYAFFQSGAGAEIAGALGTSPPLVGDYTIEGIALASSSATLQVFGIGGNGETTATNYQCLMQQNATGNMSSFWESGAGSNQEQAIGRLNNLVAQHLVIVKDGTANTVTFYVNGRFAGLVAYATEPSGGTSVVSGIVQTTAGSSGPGALGHVAFYNGIKLSAARIRAHAAAAGFV